MRSPSDRVDIVRMPNVEFATWGGDLGSDAATKAFEDARSGTRSKWDEWFPGHEASEDDLRGDLDAYGLAKILTGGPVSDALATYYQKPASEGRPAARTRYTTFAEAVGAEVKRGRIRNKNALVQRFAPRVQAFAQAWYVKLGKEKSGAVDAALEWLKRQTPLGVDDAQRIDEYSSQITALFFDWVEKKIGEGLTAEDLGPPIHMATLRGLFFETDKCFLLPAAVEHLPAIKALYDQHPDAQILVVGHTDTAGSAEHNQALSEERAAAVAAYLRDKAPDWLAWFDDAKPASKRWGVREIGHMLSALPEGAEAEKFWTGDVPSARTPAFKEAVKKFQAWANENKGLSLDVDGVPGPMTRAALVAAYMGLDGTTLPEGTRLVTVGAGEAHPAVDTGDGKSEPANRRVELFFFDQGIDPEPSKDEDHYDEWKSRVGPTTDLGEPGPHVETGAAVSVRVVQKGDQQKDDGHPLAEEPWVVRQADGTTTPGRLDAQGHAEIRCAGDTCEVTFPRRGPGSMEALTHPGEPKPELLPVKAPAGVEAGDLEALEPVRRREFFLREHRRGDPVKALQRMLKAAGVNVEETAVYDAATIAAVKAFQESKHLEVDGVVGPATLGLLDEALGLGTTFRCHREAHAEFRWRRFLAPPPVVRPIPHDAPDPSHEQPKPSPTPSGTDPHEAPTCTPVESGWQLIERSLAALQMSPGERQREYEDLANAVIGKVTLLDEAFGAGNRDEDHAVALAVYQGFAKHGRENGRFANHKNFVRLVKIVEAMEPEASLGDVTRFLRRLYYGDDLLTLGGFGMGGGEPQISQGTKDRVIAAEFKPAWQEIWGPRAGGNDYRKLDVAHSLVALDAWVNNGASGRLRAWIFTDFGDWATGVLSALDVKDAGNDNPVDKRGNDFGEQLFGTLDDHPFEKLSALLAYCFDPSRYLHGAAHAEDYEDHGQRGASVIIESDPAYASSLESPLQPHETGGGS
jgi:outer membrane protein OmpA-like peptidoglycan-associated protein